MNENQMIVLEWLKKHNKKVNGYGPFFTINLLIESITDPPNEIVRSAYFKLSNQEQFEILLKFAKYGIRGARE